MTPRYDDLVFGHLTPALTRIGTVQGFTRHRGPVTSVADLIRHLMDQHGLTELTSFHCSARQAARQ